MFDRVPTCMFILKSANCHGNESPIKKLVSYRVVFFSCQHLKKITVKRDNKCEVENILNNFQRFFLHSPIIHSVIFENWTAKVALH